MEAIFYQLGEHQELIHEVGEDSFNSVSVAPPHKAPLGKLWTWKTSLSPKTDVNFGKEGTGSWELIEDHTQQDLWVISGHKYFLNSEYEGKKYNGLGPVPSWLLTVEPEPTEPEPVVPPWIWMRQARRALLDIGLLSQVNAALAAMPGVEGERARIDWEYATTVERASPLIAALAGSLGLDDTMIDNLFITAWKIE